MTLRPSTDDALGRWGERECRCRCRSTLWLKHQNDEPRMHACEDHRTWGPLAFDHLREIPPRNKVCLLFHWLLRAVPACDGRSGALLVSWSYVLSSSSSSSESRCCLSLRSSPTPASPSCDCSRVRRPSNPLRRLLDRTNRLVRFGLHVCGPLDASAHPRNPGPRYRQRCVDGSRRKQD